MTEGFQGHSQDRRNLLIVINHQNTLHRDSLPFFRCEGVVFTFWGYSNE
jgi:hypothetical protein